MSDWYGTRPSWRVPFEAAARRKFGTDIEAAEHADLRGVPPQRRLCRRCRPGQPPRSARRRPGASTDTTEHLVYTVRDLEVDGAPATVDVVIRFCAEPLYDTFGLAAEDSPRVHAEAGRASPHRHGDDALCLWSPFDPPELRWHHDLGLLDLIEITRRHLFLERYWRMTGGHRDAVWLLPDAPHGIPAI